MWRAMLYDFCQRSLTEIIRGGFLGASTQSQFCFYVLNVLYGGAVIFCALLCEMN